MKINQQCRDLAKAFNRVDPFWTDETCSLCESVSASYVEQHIENGGSVKWLEPPTGTWVIACVLDNGHRFNLRHLHDEGMTDDDYERVLGLIEDHAGNLYLFIRDLEKYQ